jgi:hypothetical protein
LLPVAPVSGFTLPVADQLSRCVLFGALLLCGATTVPSFLTYPCTSTLSALAFFFAEPDDECFPPANAAVLESKSAKHATAESFVGHLD